MWTIPNGLSALRLLLVPTAAWILLGGSRDGLAITLLAVAGVTDWLDGFLARKLNQVSQLGTLLDPLADRLAILCFVAALAARGAFSWWLLVMVGARDLLLLMTLPALRRHGRWALPVTRTGKTGTALLFAGLPLALIGIAGDGAPVALVFAQALLWAGCAVYWLAGVGYLREVGAIRRGRSADDQHAA